MEALAFPELETTFSPKEFGTGLRDRLQVVRALAEVEELEAAPPRRDISPELMLVSGDDSGESVLAELMLSRSTEIRRAPLGILIAEAGLLAAAEIDYALTRAQETGVRLGEFLVDSGLVTPAEIIRLVAEQRGLPFLDVRKVPIDPSAARLLPADLAHLLRTLPLGFVRGLPVVAVADPTDESAMNGAESVLRSVRFVASPEDAIRAQLSRVYLSAA
jgi:Type II secretion system (T2SS), protein E, N-terminal domain